MRRGYLCVWIFFVFSLAGIGPLEITAVAWIVRAGHMIVRSYALAAKQCDTTLTISYPCACDVDTNAYVRYCGTLVCPVHAGAHVQRFVPTFPFSA